MEEKLMKILCDSLHYTFDEEACVSTLDLKKTVSNLLAAGVIIPVRCKDCPDFLERCLWSREMGPDGFCARGERKES